MALYAITDYEYNELMNIIETDAPPDVFERAASRRSAALNASGAGGDPSNDIVRDLLKLNYKAAVASFRTWNVSEENFV